MKLFCNMKTNIILILVFLLFFKHSFSQNAKLSATVVLNNDSLKQGVLQYNDWENTPDKIQFKEIGHKEFEDYTPLDIQSFTVNGITYLSKIVVIEKKSILIEDLENELKYDTISKKVFIKQLVNGNKPLFQHITRTGVHNYYIELDKDSFLLLTFKRYLNENSRIEEINKYKNQLSFYLADCSEMASVITKMNYDEKSFLKIFNKYNDCKQSNVSISKIEKPKYTIDICAGIARTQINFGGESELPFAGSNYPASTNFTSLVSIGLPLTKRFQSRYIMLELGMKNMDLNGKDNFKGGNGGNYTMSVDYKYTYLKANLLFRKYLIQKKIFSGFADDGISFGKRIRMVGEAKNLSNGVILPSYQGLTSAEGNLILGIGTCISKKIVGLARFEYGNLFSLRNDVSNKIKSWYFVLGYRF